MREIFQISKSGLMAAERAISTTGHNIANANTPGYSRQRVDLAPVDFKRNNMSIGVGVNIEQITRMRNEFLDSQINEMQSRLGSFSQRAQTLEYIEGLFVSNTGNDLVQAMTEFFNSFSELTNSPEDFTRRVNIVRNAQNMILKFQQIGSGLQEIQQQAANKAKDGINEVNTILKDLASLNNSIYRANGAGKQDNKSLDDQTRLLDRLSKLVAVDTQRDENGGLEVKIGGIIAVSGERSATLSGESDTVNNIFRVRLDNGSVIPFKGGEVGENIALFEDGIASYQEDLDELANSLMQSVNQLHTSGFDRNGNTGIAFFDPDSSGARGLSLNALIEENADRIVASAQPNAPGNNSIAAQIAQLASQSPNSSQSLTDRTINLSARAGAELSNVRQAIETTESAKILLTNQQEQVSGVNMDEELTNLIKFQNSYQASARVLNSAQQMYDTLLSIV